MQIQIDSTKAFPLAVLTLNNESALIQRGSMVYHSPNITLKARTNGRLGLGMLSKSLVGESSLITKIDSNGVGQCAISNNFPGDLAVLECGERQYKINDGSFLAAEAGANIHLSRQKLGSALFAHTGGFVIAETMGAGHIVVSSFGSIYKMELTGGKLTIDNDHVIAWDNQLDYSIHTEGGLLTSGLTGEGLVNSFEGYGSVYLQSLNMTNFLELINKVMTK